VSPPGDLNYTHNLKNEMTVIIHSLRTLNDAHEKAGQ
jgi:hypothetical protein